MGKRGDDIRGSAMRDGDSACDKYESRRYKIGEFSAMTGMSASRIRFYERAGLFPGRKEENGYRYFTPNDAFRANAFRVLLQYGFNVEQAIEMLDARQGSDEFKGLLVAQHEALLYQAELLRYRLSRIERALELMNLQPGERFRVVDVQDWLYVEASRGSDFSVAVDNAREISLFYELLNVTSCARIVSYEDLMGDSPTLDPSYVIAMQAVEGHRVRDCDQRKVRRLALGKCLRYRRIVTREQSLRRESYDDMFAYLAQRGYRVRGDSLLLPAFLNLDGEGSDLETLFVPIE